MSESSNGVDGTLGSESLAASVGARRPRGEFGRRLNIAAQRGLGGTLDGKGSRKGGRPSGVVGRRLSGVAGRRLGIARSGGRQTVGERGRAQRPGGVGGAAHNTCGGDGGAAQSASHLASSSLSSGPPRSLPRSRHLGDRLRSRGAAERDVLRPPPICSRHPSHSPCPQGNVTKGVVSSKQTGQVASINWRWPHSRL